MKQILQDETNLNPISNDRLYCEERGDQNGGEGTRGVGQEQHGMRRKHSLLIQTSQHLNLSRNQMDQKKN